MKKLYLERHSANMRANHWSLVILFLIAGGTGFALFHPYLFPLTSLFGGPQWTRIIHPYFGIVMFLFFLIMFFRVIGSNGWRKEDSEWLAEAPKLISEGNTAKMPAIGKFNAGQKLVFWVMSLCLLVLLVTGLTFWQAWFASGVSIGLQRFMVVLHAIAATVFVITIVVHAYAAIWVKGTMHGMVRGTVSSGWAKRHHPLWYRDQVGDKTNAD